MGVKWEEGIRAGKYIAKFQDESGYYFIGPDNAICQAFTACESFNINGGIWVSKKSPTDIRIFAIMDPSPAERETHGEYGAIVRSEEQTSELQSLMRSSYAVFCLTKQSKQKN